MENKEYEIKYLEYLLSGNKGMCLGVVQNYLQGTPSIIDLYENVIKPALYEVGILWEQNKISVASEHMATAITEGILNRLYEGINPQKRYNKKVVLACVEDEEHQVGIKMVADMFELHGWETFFLGAKVPINELMAFINHAGPDIVALSLSVYFNYNNLIKLLRLIRDKYPDISILVGGQGFRHKQMPESKNIKNALFFSDLYLLESYIKSLNNKIKP